MSFGGHLNKTAETVSLDGADMNLEEVRDLLSWLHRAEKWMRERRVEHHGGKRWEFEAGEDGPVGRWMVGRTVGATVPLVPTVPRKPCSCLACGRELEAGEQAWRQRPHSHGGHAQARFCARCVEQGAASQPVRLTVIEGGAA